MVALKNFSLFLLWTVLILYLSFSPLQAWPKSSIFQKLYLDKVVHITMYAVLAFLLLRSVFMHWKKQTIRLNTIVYALVFAAAFGIAVEFLQPVLTMYRKFEWMDIAANISGVFFGLYIFNYMRSRRYLGLSVIMSD